LPHRQARGLRWPRVRPIGKSFRRAPVIRAREGGSLIKTTEIKERDMNRNGRRITQTTVTAIAALSLLGASATGASAKPTIGPKKLKDNAVSTKKIKDGEVKTKDIGDGQIQMVDLSAALQAQLQPALELLDGSVTTPKLANGAVTTPKLGDSAVGSAQVAPNSLQADDLAPNSVGSSEVAPNSILAGDIAGNAIGGQELAPDSVEFDEVENGSLNAADVGMIAGSVGANFPVIAAGDCGFDLINPPGSVDLDGHAVLVTPDSGFSGEVSFHAEAENTQIRIKACNSTGVAIDPDGAGANYAYIVFG
jgi:hypothetical protein